MSSNAKAVAIVDTNSEFSSLFITQPLKHIQTYNAKPVVFLLLHYCFVQGWTVFIPLMLSFKNISELVKKNKNRWLKIFQSQSFRDIFSKQYARSIPRDSHSC